MPDDRLANVLRQRERFFTNAANYLRDAGQPVPERGKGEEILMRMRPRSQSVMEARTKLKSVWR